MAQVEEEDLFRQYNPESNSVAIIVNHLTGNMLSRWTNFLDSDGEKKWRNRDQEFEAIIKNKKELEKKWDRGWACLFDALANINADNFDQLIYIRNQGHTITEAINRQMAHYAYHVGQITYICKMIKGKDWQSLTIPKGTSQDFNAQKFAKAKQPGHFTDEFINPPADK